MSEPRTLSVEDAVLEPQADLGRARGRALVAGGVGVVLIAVGAVISEPAAFYRSYLIGWLFCLGLALGLFGISMLNHVSGGQWGVVLRRVLEASGRSLPFFLVAFIPVILGLEHLYPWADPPRDEHGHITDHLIHHKEAWLNPTGFVVRAVLYFVIWTTLAHLISRWSHRHDATGDEAYRRKMQRASAAGLVLYMLTCTGASVDWVMSLDPHWFSSLFGIAFVAGTGLSAFAFAVPMLIFLTRRKPLAEILPPRLRTKLFHDYGKLLLAFTVLWAYFAASQLIIIWSGNLPEEITWYLERSSHGWQAISLLVAVGHFALPFFVLLSAELKKKPQRLVVVAMWVLAMRWLDFYWLVAPNFGHDGVVFHWVDLVVPVGLGGIWLALLLTLLRGRAVVPVRDPVIEEVLAHG